MNIENIILGIDYNLLVNLYLISLLLLSLYAYKKGDKNTHLILNIMGFISIFLL